jgi:predicted DNA-binding antitoxin AbrB/MazE fold protein
MKQTTEAIYENGLLRPLRKIEVAEGQMVRVTVETADDEPAGADGGGGQERYDFSDLAGRLKWEGDPLETQRKLRDEWE